MEFPAHVCSGGFFLPRSSSLRKFRSQANGCPACICNTGKISKSRQAHQKPAAHVRSLCTHSCDKWSKLSSSKIEIRTVIIVLGAKITYKDHCTQIDDNGCHYTNMCCCPCFSPFHCMFSHIYRYYYINLRK